MSCRSRYTDWTSGEPVEKEWTMTEPGTEALPVGAVLASALMAANYGGDSGEDVDRLIAELEKRGVRLVSDADDDEILRSVAEARAALLADVREGVEGLEHFAWLREDAVLALLDTLSDGGPK